MKNIYVRPTNKPSRLFLNKVNNKLLLEDISNPSLKKVIPSGSYQNIYITSNSWVYDNEYYYDSFDKKIKKRIGGFYQAPNINKIILTTDQDLIKDGVQAIDDDFLEWFVKNSNCEYVETESLNIGDGKLGYVICKPKEPKQKTIEELAFEKYPRSMSEKDSELRNEFINCAKLVEERSYSEEDIMDAWEMGAREGLPLTRKKKENLFEQFKKK
jgi:hypothetical protein